MAIAQGRSFPVKPCGDLPLILVEQEIAAAVIAMDDGDLVRLEGEGTQPSLEIRRSLWDFTMGSISRWRHSDMSKPLKIRYRLAAGLGHPVSQPYAMRAGLVLEVAITHAEAARLANS